MDLTPPEPIQATHCCSKFDSGVPILDDWLQKRALRNETAGASRTFVVCNHHQIAGYYALAAGGVLRMDAPGHIRRNMPDHIPVMVLGRLAVDRRWQNLGLGRGLLKDAVRRTLNVSTQIGIRALLVHAISNQAKSFYLCHGFQESPLNPMTLMLGLDFAARHNETTDSQ